MALKNSLMLIWAASLLLANCKKEESPSSSAAVETAAKTMKAMQAARFAAPPDTTPPPNLLSFFATPGQRLGVVSLSLGYPSVHDYEKIEIYRKLGDSAPVACLDGSLALTISDFTVSTFTDEGLVPGEEYSYLACLYDEEGHTTAMAASYAVRANAKQRFFVSSATYDGNLQASFQDATFSDGLEGANARCQWHADQAELGGNWLAVLSSNTQSASSRLPIFDGVYLLNGAKLASNREDLWDGELNRAAEVDEHGVVVDGNVWSGATSSGAISDYHCSGWASTASYGYVGSSATTPNDTAAEWLTATMLPCAQTAHLYCLETDAATYEAPTVKLTTTATTGSLAVQVDYSELGGTSLVKLFRQAGNNFLNPSCEYNASLSAGYRIKLLTVYNGEDELLSDVTFTDSIDFDNDSSFAGEEGKYIYYACAYDSYGNLRAINASTGIEQGSTYLRAFVSDNSYDGSALSLAVANTECQNSAANASLTGTFKALLADEATSANSNINTASPVPTYIYDLAGNYSGRYLGNGSYEFSGLPPSTNASGVAIAAETGIWTGVSGGGSYVTSCNSGGTAWASNTSSVYGAAASISARPLLFYTFRYYRTCSVSQRVWCVEAN